MMRRFLAYSNPKGFANKSFFTIMFFVIATILVDTVVLKGSVFITNQLHQDLTVALFILISAALFLFQYFILGHTRSKMKQMEIGETTGLSTVRFGIIIGQYAMYVIFATLILQILLVSYFSTILLTISVAVSYSLSIAALALLALRFLIWYKSNRNGLVLLYGISSLILVLNAVFTLTFAIVILNDKNPQVVPHAGVTVLNISPGSLKDGLNQVYVVSSIAAFIIMWLSTTLLLRYYSKTFGKGRYWVVLSAPLVYFMTQFVILFIDVFDPLAQIDPTLVNLILTIVFALSKPAGGILFGIAFWLVAKKAGGTVVQNYLTIAGYGLILFFASNQAVVLVAGTFYPPFGLGSVSYVGLSSYLILIGIYFSAISISQDRNILSTIRKSAKNELKLLDSIGSAENKEKIISVVTRIAKNNQSELVQESGVQSSLNEDDMKRYLDDVINELKLKREEKSKEKDDGSGPLSG